MGRRAGHHPDYYILFAVFMLTVFGLVMLVSASSELAKERFDDSAYYLKQQIMRGFLPGILGFFLASRIYYRRYQKFSFALLLVSMIGLVLVFTDFGSSAGGAGRWLTVGPVTFQPAEILKLTLILYIAAWLANPRANRARDFAGGFLPFFLVTGVVAALLLAQPATSVVVILLGAGVLVYFVSGAPLRYVGALFLLGFLVLGALVYFTPYRLERVRTFFTPERDALASGYHVNEALTAISTGGLWGVGFGQSEAKSGRLPAPMSDSIFAVIASELGFVGAGALVLLFGFLVVRMFLLARKFDEPFGRFLLVGFGSVIALQAIVNVGAMTDLMPLTGVPLPFVSFGGTALAVFLTMAGIAVNVTRYT